MLIAARIATAENVPTGGKKPRGHAEYSNDGLVATIKACDDRFDHIGVAAFILDQRPEGATGAAFFTLPAQRV